MALINFPNTNYYFFYELPTSVDLYGNEGIFYTGSLIKLNNVLPPQGASSVVGPGGRQMYGTTTTSFIYEQKTVKDAIITNIITYYVNVQNLSFNIKYNGSLTPPTGSASQATTINVVVTMSGPVVSTVSFSYVILPPAQQQATATFKGYTKTYDGSSYNMAEQFSTNSTETPVFTYTGEPGTTYGPSSAPPVNAGKYRVNVSVPSNATFSSASATAYLTINTLKNVSNFIFNTKQTYYSGSARPLTCSVTPSTLQYTVYYNGSTQAPSSIGSYSVVARITDTNVDQTATNTQIVGTYSIVRSSQIASTAANSTTLIRATYVSSIDKFLVDFIGTYQ